jgi:hypothetical protein
MTCWRSKHKGNIGGRQAGARNQGGTVPPFPAGPGLTRSKVAAVGTILHRRIMMFDSSPSRRPNPLAPSAMTPTERRAELCAILALGLIRLRARQSSQLSELAGESSLHYAPDRSGHAKPKRGRTA